MEINQNALEDIADNIIQELDSIARDYNGFDDYGLPTHDVEKMKMMSDAIISIFKKT